MGSKTISLADDAYEALLAVKRPEESFSDAVRRLTRRRSLTDLAGIMKVADADAVGHAVDLNRKERMARRRRELDR